MSVASVSHIDAPDWREIFADQDWQGRVLAYGLAAVLHIAFVYVLIALSPAITERAGQAISAIEVRLYTVAGGPGADTDAPLFEPPLSAQADGLETGAGASQGVSEGEGAGVTAGTNDPDTPEIAAPETPAPVETIEPVNEPEIELTEPEVLPDRVDTPPADAVLLRDRAPETVASDTARSDTPAATAQPRVSPPPPVSSDAPLATTQIPAPVRNRGRQQRVRFADILARAETRLNPDDFQYIELLGGVSGTIRGSFCLSSASGNREAMDCPDTPSPESVELARYGLMGIGEEMPEFMEDMDRLAFELQQLGANSSAVDRILAAVGAARREAIATDPLIRSMQRDGAAQVDNLGSALNSILPDNARDPSGEN